MFSKHPNHITSLAMHNLVDSEVEIDGKFVPSRPVSYPTFFQRIRYAWWVFIGKADVMTWPGQ